MAVLLLFILIATITLFYVKAIRHNIKCIENCDHAVPVEERFSKMRKKEWLIAAPLGFFLPAFLMYFPVRAIFYLRELSLGTKFYVNYYNDINPTLFLCAWSMSYLLYYVGRTMTLKKLLGVEYNNYCTSYNVQVMNGGNAHLPDNPIKFHWELLELNKELLLVGVAVACFSFIMCTFGLNEHAYFRDDSFQYCNFGTIKRNIYSAEDFSKIYLVDSLISFTGYESERNYYAFEFKDGNRITFHDYYDTPSKEFIQYALDFSGLKLTRIHVLDNGG